MGTVKLRKKNIDALELLVEQHDKVEQLIEQVSNESLIERKQFLFDELAATITAHATMEEKLFYPTVRAEQTQEILLETEHAEIKRAIADLAATDVDDDRFDAKLSVLAEELEHHAREEEEQILFPKLRQLMSAEQLTVLGSEMLALFERLMSTPRRLQRSSEPRRDVSV
ncbi:MAG: hemerythrin domain-containing protein [Myxococcota bacterium]|nr:hemerythrin domain-containing protein [Deltaproteobacteria bacterium]MDQ3334817.1 hemerythrin domain-containing protein [Myxococcota bacterium]